jgi:hypothetical protein
MEVAVVVVEDIAPAPAGEQADTPETVAQVRDVMVLIILQMLLTVMVVVVLVVGLKLWQPVVVALAY